MLIGVQESRVGYFFNVTYQTSVQVGTVIIDLTVCQQAMFVLGQHLQMSVNGVAFLSQTFLFFHVTGLFFPETFTVEIGCTSVLYNRLCKQFNLKSQFILNQKFLKNLHNNIFFFLSDCSFFF